MEYPAIIRSELGPPILVCLLADIVDAEFFLTQLGIGARWQDTERDGDVLLVPVVHANIVAATRAGRGMSPAKRAACQRNAKLAGRKKRHLPTMDDAFALARERNQAINAVIDQSGKRFRCHPSGHFVEIP